MKQWKKQFKRLALIFAISVLSVPVWASEEVASDHQVLIPYVDAEEHTLATLKDLTLTTQITQYNIGFMAANKDATLVWYENRLTRDMRYISEGVSQQLKELRALGGDGSITFGVPSRLADERETALKPLYEVEQDVEKLTKAYEEVIKKYNLKAADFYISGQDFSRTKEKQVEAQLDALVALQKRQPKLELWLSFEVGEKGVSDDVAYLIGYGLEKGLKPHGINWIVVDYDDDGYASDGTIAILKSVHKTLKDQLDIKEDKKIWALMGVTSILEEGFYEEDAKAIAQFAKDKQLGRISYYTIDEDDQMIYAKAYAEVLIDTTPPKAPVALEALFTSFDQVTLSWKPQKEEDQAVVFNVFRKTNNQKIEHIAQTTKDFYVDTDVKANTTYTYFVTGLDRRGNESEPSKTIEVTTLKNNLSKLRVDEVKDDDVTKTSIKLSFRSVPNASEYVIYRDGQKVKNTKDTEFTDEKLVPDTTYYYVITAKDRRDEVVAQSETIAIKTKAVEKDDDDEAQPDVTIPEYKGYWRAGANYAVGDLVVYQGKLYSCTTGHLSLQNWQPSNVPALWNRVPVDLEDLDDDEDDDEDEDDEDDEKNKPGLGHWLSGNGKDWQVQVKYEVGDFVRYKGKIYTCVQAHTAYVENWNPASANSLWGLFEGDEKDLKFFGIDFK